jgi:hypothetical protein
MNDPSMRGVRFARSPLPTGPMLLLLAFAACGSPSNERSLFSQRPAQISSAAGGSGAGIGLGEPHAGSPGSSGSSDAASGAAGSTALSNDRAGTDSGGAASASAGKGSGGAASAGKDSGGAENAGDSALAGGGNEPSACAAYGVDAAYFSDSQHCYLAVHELLSFAAAQSNCVALGGHLVTIADDAENAFAWSMSAAEHWIGANDGKGPREPGVGSYAWLTGEAFSYEHWTAGQPNASATDCNGNGGAGCYEHCAFQWNGGGWNDRYCLHMIESVCEWDTTAPP